MRSRVEHELLILSDLHLHSRTPAKTVQVLTGLLSRAAEASSRTGRPCRAVLAGDFFDFPMIAEVPEPGVAPFEVSAREKRFGLDPTGKKTAWKVEFLSRLHPGLFRALSRFLAAGNDLVFLPGNHDEETLLPEVQECLRDLLQNRPAGGRQTRGAAAAAAGTLTFSPWFHYEPGRVYVEHGHFYDVDNVPQPPVRRSPLPPASSLEQPLGALMARHLLSALPWYDSRGDSNRTPWPLLMKVLRTCGPRAPLTIYRYYAAAARILAISRERRRRRNQERDNTLAELAADLGVCPGKLQELLAHTAKPTLLSCGATLRRLYLDRSAAFAVFLVSSLSALPLAGAGRSWPFVFPALALLVLLFTVRKGNRFGHRTAVQCREAAQRIQRTLSVPCVVMGHAHGAEKIQGALPDGTTWCYANAGSFDDPGPGHSARHPFVVLRGSTGAGIVSVPSLEDAGSIFPAPAGPRPLQPCTAVVPAAEVSGAPVVDPFVGHP